MPRLLSLSKTQLPALAALLGACALFPLTVRAVDYTWDPSGNRSDAAGSGAWNTSSAVWDNGSADVVWGNNVSYNAIFKGVDGNYNVTVANGISAGTGFFNASGYTLQGASAATPGTINFGGSGSSSLEVATGKTVTIGSNLTASLNFYANVNPTSNGTVAVVGGTLGIFSYSFFGGGLSVGTGGTFNGTLATYGQSRAFAITVDGAGAAFNSNRSTFNNTTVTINNGTFALSGGGIGNTLTNTTIQLNAGGTFSASDVRGNGSGSVVRLNGGTVKTDSPNYPAFPTTALQFSVQAGGAKFNTGFFTISLPVGLMHDAGGPAIDGGLNTTGSGMLSLTAASTYTGGTTVAGGKLSVSANGALGTGDVSVLTSGICLTIGTGVTTLFNNTTAGLSLAGGGTANQADVGYLDLSSGANIFVTSLVLGTTTYTNGVFTSANAPEYILGGGSVTVVPEPGTVALLLVAGAGLGVLARRRTAR